MDPSGIDTSRTNCAKSQRAWGCVVEVGRTTVGREAAVFVETIDGSVGVLKDNVGVSGVSCACMVWAAAVNTRLGSSVAGALDGKLHAESINMIMVKIEVLRISLYILFSSIYWALYTNTDGVMLWFVPSFEIKKGAETGSQSGKEKLFLVGHAIRRGRDTPPNNSSQYDDCQKVWQPGEEVIIDTWVSLLEPSQKCTQVSRRRGEADRYTKRLGSHEQQRAAECA